MKNISLKWKIFLIGNYLELISYGAFLALIIYKFIQLTSGKPTPDAFAPTCTWLVLNILNNLLCIYAFHRYHQSGNIPRRTKSLIIVSGIINIIFITLVTIGFTTAAISTFSEPDDYNRVALRSYVYIFSVWFILLLTFITLIWQFRLPAFLKKNYDKSITSLIDSIGTEI